MNLSLRKTPDRSKPNRRDFMVQSTCAGLGITSMVNTLSHLQLMSGSAMAAGPTDMKALVCIFLAGGNDSNNLLVPMGGTARSDYEVSRGLPQYAGGPGGVAIPLGELAATEITPTNVTEYDAAGYTNNDLALHPGCMHLRNMFEAGELAFIANVGTLAEPGVSRLNFASPSPTKPTQLFSHSDQVLQWQSSVADRPFVRGWGGGLADAIHASQNTNSPGLAMGVSLSGVNSFQVGLSQQPFILSTAGAQSFAGFGTNYAGALNNTTLKPFGDPAAGGYDPTVDTNYKLNTNEGQRLRALERLMAMTHQNVFDTSFEATAKNARQTEGVVAEVLNFTKDASGNNRVLDEWFTAAFDGSATAANNDFANQLKMVARMIIGNWKLMNDGSSPYRGNNRMTFYVQQGGYDTHASQLAVNGNNTINTGAGQYALLWTLSRAIKGFSDAIKNHPNGGTVLWNKVMSFTSSDFNRTFTPNKTDASGGSDHGWGGHAFVFGGAVNGKKIYGTFPQLVVEGGIDCTGSRGRWIPSTSVEQYTSKFAEWIGVPSGDIPEIFPNLNRFPAATNLNFINPAIV
jgi:uncharacterized protein (DUF1501 family)